MRRYDALARHERAQHADSQIKVFNLGIVSMTERRDVYGSFRRVLWRRPLRRRVFRRRTGRRRLLRRVLWRRRPVLRGRRAHGGLRGVPARGELLRRGLPARRQLLRRGRLPAQRAHFPRRRGLLSRRDGLPALRRRGRRMLPGPGVPHHPAGLPHHFLCPYPHRRGGHLHRRGEHQRRQRALLGVHRQVHRGAGAPAPLGLHRDRVLHRRGGLVLPALQPGERPEVLLPEDRRAALCLRGGQFPRRHPLGPPGLCRRDLRFPLLRRGPLPAGLLRQRRRGL